MFNRKKGKRNLPLFICCNKINAAKLRFGENYSVETEKTFPSLVDLNLFNALLLNEDLKIADKDRVMKNIKRWKYKCR